MFNLVKWLSIKSKVAKMVENGDVSGLKKIISETNGELNEYIDKDFFDNYSVSDILSFFDVNGKVIASRFDFRRIFSSPYLVYYIVKSDPEYIDALTQEQKDFVLYCSKEIDEGRREDIFKILPIFSLYVYNEPNYLENLFDGNDFTSKVYRNLLSNPVDINKLSEKTKGHYTPFELKISKINHNISEYSGNFEKNEKLDAVRELILFLEPEELPKFIKIVPGLTGNYTDISMSDDIIPKIIFSTRLKELIYGYNFNKFTDDDLNQLIRVFKDKALVKTFILNDTFLNKLLFEYNFSLDELKTILYMKDDDLFIKPEIISSFINNNAISDELLNVIGSYFDSNLVNDLVINNPQINKNAIGKIANIYKKIGKISKAYVAKDYILNELSNNLSLFCLPDDKLDRLENILLNIVDRIQKSNAAEFKIHGGDILFEILKNNNFYDYDDALNKIQKIFEKDTLPTFMKKYFIFKILNPNLEKEDFKNNKRISPTLKNIDPNKRYELLFQDLISISLSNNNYNLINYLKQLKHNDNLYSSVKKGNISFDKLSLKEKNALNDYLSQLLSLYEYGDIENKVVFKSSGNLLEDLDSIINMYGVNENESVLDKITQLYCLNLGIERFEQIFDYMNYMILTANKDGRERAREVFDLNKGDYVKGIGDIKYLYDILQNGSLCKEFLGPFSSSDMTPLDTDFSIVLDKKLTMEKTLNNTIAGKYGPIWFTLKKDRFTCTRSIGNDASEGKAEKKECFSTLGNGAMGIRTGFSTGDIDYIMIDTEEVSAKEVSFLVALNGIYIPIVDCKTRKNIFTPAQYDEIRDKMDGLSYYENSKYNLSQNLDVLVDYDNKALIEDANNKREKIDESIEKLLKEQYDYKLITGFSSNVELGTVQLIDTGSTGRGTNVDSQSDFDFIMRVDDGEDLEQLARTICENFNIDFNLAKENGMVIANNNLRLKNINLSDVDDPVSIDITFQSKADKVVYTTDMAIKDRLESIKEQYPDQYEKALDNIIFAKQFLKKHNVYKPSHSRNENQGGLGGVGIENWILQNGCSFYDACMSFYLAGTDKYGNKIPFEDFKDRYKVYDFGENFYNGKHDEFVEDNMTKSGYNKMYKAVKEYINVFNNVDSNSHLEQYSSDNSTNIGGMDL